MLRKNLKTRVVFLILFFISMAISVDINKTDRDEEINKELDKKSKLVQQSYDAVINEITNNAISTSAIIYQDELVIDTMKKAPNVDETKRKILRDKLQKHLSPLYEMLKSEGVVSFHFVLSNRISFLRVHQPTKFGDNISSERFTYDKVYRTNEEAFGLEDGMFNTSFRHVFPLFDQDHVYIGAYEISYSLDYIRKLMKEIDAIDTKIIYDLNTLQDEQLIKRLKDKKAFSIYEENNSDMKVISYLPLLDVKGEKILAYLVHESKNDYIENILKREQNRLLASLIILLVMFALVYKLTTYQQNLAKERERFQLAIDSSNDGIWDWNIDKNEFYLSPQFKYMLGYKKNELNISIKELQEMIHEDEKENFANELEQLLTNQKSIFECEYRVKNKDGNWIWILGRAKAQYNKQNKATRVVGFQSDITIKKEYEQKQEKLIEELKDVAEAKSNFLATMSHEIRTPMNAVLGFIQILVKKEDDPKKLKMLQTINESGNSLLRIINDILDFSKIANNKLEIDKINFGIVASLKQLQILFSSKAREKNITINLKVDKKLPTNIHADKIRVEQVLSNLLSNAIKFSDKNSSVDLIASYKDETHSVLFEIKDNGVGISKEKLEHIFDAFTQEDSSTTRKYGGTGLGLSISKRLSELMDAKLWVESELNVGSSFFFELPLDKHIQIQTDISHNEIQEKVEVPKLKGTILVVEDNVVNQELLSEMLKEYNIKHFIANDGVEAVNMVKTIKFDLILMDENMPNMNGIEATKVIRGIERLKDIPIVAVTANALQGDKEKFLSAGMDEYISKPIVANQLDAVLVKYLKGK